MVSIYDACLPDSVRQDLWNELSKPSNIVRAIGGPSTKFPSVEIARKVNVDYPDAAAQAFVRELASKLPPGDKFRFCYVSGHFVERDLERGLWFFKDTRRMKDRLTLPLPILLGQNLRHYDKLLRILY